MLDLFVHKNFTKDMKKAQLNPTNHTKLFLYISLLLNQKNLPAEALDHALEGEWHDTREFHISGDLLVIYHFESNRLELLRIGTPTIQIMSESGSLAIHCRLSNRA